MKDRIRQLMESQHMQQNNFAEVLGISAGSLSGIFSGRTKPTINIVNAIKEKFARVNTDWLLFGTGSMYLDDRKASAGLPGGQGAGGQSAGVGSPSGASAAQQPSPTLFSQGEVNAQQLGVQPTLKNQPVEIVKYINKPTRRITEIRVFYDDQTWETFVPKK